jgi:hypothetical protein
VQRFCELDPYPLTIEKCRNSADVSGFIRGTLRKFGGIGRYRRIGKEAAYNLEWLEEEGWEKVEESYSRLSRQRSRSPTAGDFGLERETARFIDKYMKGFGPKQSRNLWQLLGVTRYEIPIDSRVTKWVNGKLSFKIRRGALRRSDYYESVLDDLQKACRAAEVLPCVLDSAVIARADHR